MKKGIKNVDEVVRKLRLVLIKATNKRLKIAKKEKQKREEIVEK